MSKIPQSRDIRNTFLKHGEEIINRLVNHACGFDNNEDGTRGEFTGRIREDILLKLTEKLIPIMSLEDDHIPIEKSNQIAKAKTIDELIELNQNGHISTNQLRQYTEIIKTNYEVTELNQLLEKLEDMENAN